MTYKIMGAIMGAAALAGCAAPVYQETLADKHHALEQRYLGLPVRAFVEDKSIAPSNVIDNGDGSRTYLFRIAHPYGSCGVTIVASLSDRGNVSGFAKGAGPRGPSGGALLADEYLTRRLTTTCTG